MHENSSSTRLRLVAYSTNTWVSPLAQLRILAPARQCGIQVVLGAEGDQDYPERVADADLVLIQRDFPRRLKAYQQILFLARQQGKPVVYDLDDLLLELPEDHPDRLNHYYADALLPMLHALSAADAVTVSNALLADYVRPFNSNVFLLPNYLDDQLWKLHPPKSSETGDSPLVIGYMGGESHLEDLRLVAPALMEILQRYGSRVALHVLGVRPPEELLAQPNITWRPSKTHVYADFAADFASQPADLFIAPLRDNHFNRCKSAIKFLEYSSMGIPGIYSRIEPYSSVVSHGKNGLLAYTGEEWVVCLAELIEKPELRRTLGQSAQETVRRDWLLSEHAQQWADVYQSLLAGERRGQSTSAWGDAAVLRILDQVSEWQRDLKTSAEGFHTQQAEHEQALRESLQTVQSLQTRLEATEKTLSEINRQLLDVYSSTAWQIVKWLWRLRLAIFPKGSRRERLAQGLMSRLRPGRGVAPNAPAAAPETGTIPGAATLSTATTSPALPLPTSPPATQESPLTSRVELQFNGASFGDIDLLWQARPAKYDLIVMPVMDWESRVQRPQQIALQFAGAGQRVFYLHTAFRQQAQPLVRRVDENIYEVQLSSHTPVNIYQEAMSEPLQQTAAAELAAVRNAFGITEAVTMVDLPFWAPLAAHLRQVYGWRIIYDCMDNHRGFSTNTQQMLDQEDILIATSDLVLVASYPMLAAISAVNPHCILVPNGADFTHFRFAPSWSPPDIAGLAKPIIGYHGAISDWFDSELVRDLALARPQWNFVLIGSTLYGNTDVFQKLPNVILLGEKPYQQLPAYLHHYDVAIIPLKKTLLTQYANQLKMYEYLSAGKPVVSTDLEDMLHYTEQARLASTPQQWVEAIEAALQDNSPQQVQKRLAFARQNTWQARYAQITAEIAEIYPKVSVIILTYNNLDYTRLCLESLYQKTAYPNFEVIVVDNASTDGTPTYLKEFATTHENMRLILNATNTGFARGNNTGAAAAIGEILVFLNNDTVVTRDWLSGLVAHLRDTSVGMVGAVTNHSCNEGQIEVDYTHLRGMDAFAARYTRAHAGEVFQIRMLPFFCVAMRRALFDEVGPLDENFAIGMFEDDDYAMRVKSRGYKVVCAEDVFVHHWGSASFSKIDPESYQRIFNENRQKFEAKWGVAWQMHQYRKNNDD